MHGRHLKNALDAEHKVKFAPADREAVLDAIKANKGALQYASTELRSDRDFMKQVVSIDAMSGLYYASPELKADKNFVLEASKRGSSIVHAAPSLHADRDFVLQACGITELALKYASAELREDRQTCLDTVVLSHGAALKHVPSAMAGPDFEQDAIRRNGLVLQHASPALRADSETVLAAVQQNPDAIAFANLPELQKNKGFLKRLLRLDAAFLSALSPEATGDRQLIFSVISKAPEALKYAAHEVRSDREFLGHCVTKNRASLEFAAPEVQEDRVFIFNQALKSGYVLAHAAESIRGDPEFMLAVIRARKSARVRGTPMASALKYASDALRNDPAFVLAVIEEGVAHFFLRGGGFARGLEFPAAGAPNTDGRTAVRA
jgi:hypothetical protein